MLNFIHFLFDILIPRFITEEVALIKKGESYDVLCCMNDITGEDTYDAIGVSKCFTWLGFGFFATIKVK